MEHSPSAELIAAIIALKRRNPRFGCVRIVEQIAHAFGVDIDKDVVRRVLGKHYRPGDSAGNDPSWLAFIAHTKDSLWSVDLFRCESILLHSHWVLVVTIRREYLDHLFFWNAVDLTRKLGEFRDYYNAKRVHRALAGSTPAQRAGAPSPAPAALNRYAWQRHCHGLFHMPIAASVSIRHPHEADIHAARKRPFKRSHRGAKPAGAITAVICTTDKIPTVLQSLVLLDRARAGFNPPLNHGEEVAICISFSGAHFAAGEARRAWHRNSNGGCAYYG